MTRPAALGARKRSAEGPDFEEFVAARGRPASSTVVPPPPTASSSTGMIVCTVTGPMGPPPSTLPKPTHG